MPIDQTQRSGNHSGFRAIADAVPDILFTTRSDGAWDYVNSRFSECTGLAQSAGLAEGWVGALHPGDAGRVLEKWREAIAEDRIFEMRFRVRGSEGEYRWFLSRAKPVQDEDGTVARWCGTWTDIDRLERAERALRLSEERFRAALKASLVMVFGQDRELRYTWVHNPLKGFSSEAMIGKRDRDILNRRADAQILETLKRRVLDNGVGLRQEVLLCMDGEDRFYDLTIEPERDNDRVVGITCAALDNTDRVRLETQLRKLAARLAKEHRRKDEFFAMLGHELRNPLAPISNAVNLLQVNRRVDEQELRKAMDMVGRQVSHLTKIVDDLLDIGRIISGQLEFNKEPLSLAEVVRSAVETAESTIYAHGHRLQLMLPGEQLQVHGDRLRLSQAIVNLLQNAAKYTKEPSVIMLTLEREGNEALVKVRDNGIGISQDMLPRVFDMFTQADRSLARSEGGLGLGLALVRTVAEAHRGRATGFSDGPGQGSEFVLRLPLMRDVPSQDLTPSVTPSDAEKEGGDVGIKRLLVVDDNVDVAQSFAALLRVLGHEVTVAFSSRDALEAVESFKPEAVFLDIGLPEMDGYEVAQRIRERYPQGSPILIALSGYGQERHIRRSQEAGFYRHLLKPPDIAAVKKLLAGLAVGTE